MPVEDYDFIKCLFTCLIILNYPYNRMKQTDFNIFRLVPSIENVRLMLVHVFQLSFSKYIKTMCEVTPQSELHFSRYLQGFPMKDFEWSFRIFFSEAAINARRFRLVLGILRNKCHTGYQDCFDTVQDCKFPWTKNGSTRNTSGTDRLSSMNLYSFPLGKTYILKHMIKQSYFSHLVQNWKLLNLLCKYNSSKNRDYSVLVLNSAASTHGKVYHDVIPINWLKIKSVAAVVIPYLLQSLQNSRIADILQLQIKLAETCNSASLVSQRSTKQNKMDILNSLILTPNMKNTSNFTISEIFSCKRINDMDFKIGIENLHSFNFGKINNLIQKYAEREKFELVLRVYMNTPNAGTDDEVFTSVEENKGNAKNSSEYGVEESNPIKGQRNETESSPEESEDDTVLGGSNTPSTITSNYFLSSRSSSESDKSGYTVICRENLEGESEGKALLEKNEDLNAAKTELNYKFNLPTQCPSSNREASCNPATNMPVRNKYYGMPQWQRRIIEIRRVRNQSFCRRKRIEECRKEKPEETSLPVSIYTPGVQMDRIFNPHPSPYTCILYNDLIRPNFAVPEIKLQPEYKVTQVPGQETKLKFFFVAPRSGNDQNVRDTVSIPEAHVLNLQEDSAAQTPSRKRKQKKVIVKK